MQLKSLLLSLVFVALAPQAAFAQSASFPFSLARDSNGKILRIEIPVRTMMATHQEDDLLEDLKRAYDLLQEQNARISAMSEEPETLPEDPEERAAYLQAKEFISNKFAKNDLEDPRLKNEFEKAKHELLKHEIFRLLASPHKVDAFDTEAAASETVKRLLDAAKQVFDVAPPFAVFEYLVDTYLESMKSRREFYQNQLLVFLTLDKKMFTDAEKNLIRSSIFYSRIGLLNLPARKKARDNFAKYGLQQIAAVNSKCSGFVNKGDTSYGPCFKVVGHKLENRLVKLNLASNSTSIAYNYDKPYAVRDTRILFLLTRLGLKFVPTPGPVKTALNEWIGSHYREQRRSEGYVFGYATARGEKNLAAWIKIGSANPLLGH